MATSKSIAKKTVWKGRPAFRLANEQVELVTLACGGSIADFRLRGEAGLNQNVLWESPWNTMDPARYRANAHKRIYGAPFLGKFLAGFTGHALCLDFFGAPSEEEIRQGLCLHGEAGVSPWRAKSWTASRLVLETSLPAAGLEFRRELRMHQSESVVYVRETISNLRASDHFFHWTQHVTLGPPFLHPEESVIALPGTRCMTWPHGYQGMSLLANSKEFTWPLAPGEDGNQVDLSRPFVRAGTGFVAAVLLDSSQPLAYVAALNYRMGIVAGYCFPTKSFPWVTLWEENRARPESPWKGRTQARGIEFGTTPFPVGKRETFAAGPLFGAPTWQCIPAKSELQVSYAMFVAAANGDWRGIQDVRCGTDAIDIVGDSGKTLKLAAQNLKSIAG